MLFETTVRSVASEWSTSASMSVSGAPTSPKPPTMTVSPVLTWLTASSAVIRPVAVTELDSRTWEEGQGCVTVRCRFWNFKTSSYYVEHMEAINGVTERVPAARGYSQSLERGLAILAAFTSEQPLLGVSDLSRAIDLSRSTAHRYIATLTKLGYLEQDAETKRYRLGPRVLDLGFSALNSMELRQIAAPHLQQLSDETGHTVNMAILDGADIVYIERCRSSQPGQREIDLNLHVGSRLPAYCTSIGKVLLAFVPGRSRWGVCCGEMELLRRGPEHHRRRPKRSAAELAEVRSSGGSPLNEELAYGLRSIAVPVRSRSGEVVAAINLAVHRSLVSMADLVARTRTRTRTDRLPHLGSARPSHRGRKALGETVGSARGQSRPEQPRGVLLQDQRAHLVPERRVLEVGRASGRA